MLLRYSPRVTLWAIWFAFMQMLLGFALAYSDWIKEDCIDFLPFISDLALHGEMKNIFTVVLLVTGSIFGVVGLPSIIIARHYLVETAKLSEGWRLFNRSLSVCGSCIVIGVMLLSFLPWDKVFWPHIVCAGTIFGGGFCWVVGGAALSYRLSASSDSNVHWNARPGLRNAQFWVLIPIVCSAVFALCTLVLAVDYDPEMFRPSTLPAEVGIARSDFAAYCEARGGWHVNPWVNWVAVSEWLYFLCLAVGCIASVADVFSYSAATGALSESLLKN